MSSRHLLTMLLSIPLVASLGACGGGGTQASIAPPPPVADEPPADDEVLVGQFAMGPIANFGSIVLGGVRYDTDDAEFVIDDRPGTEDDLAVGDVVFIDGVIDQDGMARALRVIFDESVEGPIDAIDLGASRLTVLGQTVIVDPDTSFDDNIAPPALDSLSVGDWVEVSGLVDADGAISATRIERKAPGLELEVHGVVRNLDLAAQRFTLNALTVDFSAATLSNFASGQPADGDLVEVKGMAFGAAGELLATSVERESALPIDSTVGALLEIEGFVSRFGSPFDFDVSGLRVSTDAGTVFEGGAAEDLGLNVKVEIEGFLDEGGVLRATKVDIRRARVVRVAAAIDSVAADSSTLEMLGIRVTVDSMTRLEDKSDQDLSPLTLTDLNVGDYVEVRGDEFPAGSDQLRAGLLEREDPDEDTELQGFVSAVSEPSLTILGVTVSTDSRTEYRDESDLPLTATAFFARLEVGHLVKVEGLEVEATTIVAAELEFETED